MNNMAKTLCLRQATAADIAAMWEVRYAVTENTLTPGRLSDEDVRREIEDTGRGWVVERADGPGVDAFAIGNGRSGNVWALFVHPRAQGRGLGDALHRTMLGWFATQPVATLWLSTGTDTRARGFYERRGWACVGPYGQDELRLERSNHQA
jgi:GNAT superfamily N-acetyltransferase